MKARLLIALLCYLALGSVAALTMNGKPLAVVLILLGALAAKTWIHFARGE